MMDYDGLVVRYPVNRKLEDEERLKRVEPEAKTSYPPQDFNLAIARSSDCLEVADKYFEWKAYAQIFVLPVVGAMGFLLWISASGVAEQFLSKRADFAQAVAALSFGVLVSASLFLWGLWIILRETFTLTHYPIRFNRENRMVYVFRPKRWGDWLRIRRDDILRVKWDDVYWHIRHNKNKQFGGYNWFVAGHVMDKDRKTVRETFAFGHVGGSPEEVYPQWEYVRRFMQDGPDAVPQAKFHLPIAERKEGFWWGAQTLLLHTPQSMFGTVVLLPLLTPAVFTRWLCMLTSRVPRWPDDIEAECAVSAKEQRSALGPARPHFAKLAALLTAGLMLDAALLMWLYSTLWAK
jgi:hypothetical protein